MSPGGRTRRRNRQFALDNLDVVGAWSWDAATDRVHADAHVALLFDLDPDAAEAGAPVAEYLAGVHLADRPHAAAAFREDARARRPRAREFRVRCADGVERWVLMRGQFSHDHLGRAVSGRGIVVDITALRSSCAGDEEEEARIDGPGGAPLDRAAASAIAAYRAIGALDDLELKARAEALLYQIGRRLAAQEKAGHAAVRADRGSRCPLGLGAAREADRLPEA